MSAEVESGRAANLPWIFLAKRALKIILLLFAAALLADIIYFGVEPLHEANALDEPIVLRTNPPSSDMPIDGQARWRSELWQEPAPKRTVAISASPFLILFDFELIAKKTHPIAESVAMGITDPENAAALFETAFGKVTVDGQQLRSEDFQSPTWTLSAEDQLMHIRMRGFSRAQQNAIVGISRSDESRPVCDEFNLSFSGMRLVSFFPVPDEASESHARLSGETLKDLRSIWFRVDARERLQDAAAANKDASPESRQKYLIRHGFDLPFVGRIIFSVIKAMPLLIFLAFVSAQRRQSLAVDQQSEMPRLVVQAAIVTGALLVLHFATYFIGAIGEVGPRLFRPVATNLMKYTWKFFEVQGAWRIAPVVLGVLVPALLFQRARNEAPPSRSRVAALARWTVAALLLGGIGYAVAAYVIQISKIASPALPMNWMVAMFLASAGTLLLWLVFRWLYAQVGRPVARGAVLLASFLVLAMALIENWPSAPLRELEPEICLALSIALGSALLLAIARLVSGRLFAGGKLFARGWIGLLIFATAIVLAIPTGEILQGLPSRAVFTTLLLSFGYQLDNVLIFVWAGALLVLLYEGGKSGPQLDDFTRFAGILIASGIFFSATDRWLYIPVRFLAGLWLLTMIVRPAKLWSHLRRAYERVFLDRAMLLSLLIDLKSAESAYADFRNALSKKLSTAEITLEKYDADLAQATWQIAELRKRTSVADRPGKELALAFGPYDSAWQNAMHGSRWALLLALPWIGLFVRDYLNGPLTAASYPLWGFITDFLNVVTSWGGVGFFLGYFYPYIRGRTGLQKGLTLFAGIVLPALPLMALFNTSAHDWRPALFWFLQVFIQCMLVGLIAFDYQIVRKSGYGWQMLLDLHGLTSIGISVSSILAAIGVAITTLLSTQASTLVSNALKLIVPPPAIEAKTPSSPRADAQQKTQPPAE